MRPTQECPDVFEVANGTWVLKWSDQSKSRKPFSMDWYVIGSQSGLRGNETSLAAVSTGAEEHSTFAASMQPVQQCASFLVLLSCKSPACMATTYSPQPCLHAQQHSIRPAMENA